MLIQCTVFKISFGPIEPVGVTNNGFVVAVAAYLLCAHCTVSMCKIYDWQNTREQNIHNYVVISV